MNDLRKAAGMALVALNSFDPHDDELWYSEKSADEIDSAITALRQALAQPEQEPVLAGSLSVRYFRGDKAMTDTYFEYLGDLSEGDYTLYTAPPKREWVGLTDEEIDGIYKTHHDQYGKCQTGGFDYERSIEAKLKEKNA